MSVDPRALSRRVHSRPPWRSSRRDRTRAQALVELAIILPVLLLLVAAALDLGRLFYARIASTTRRARAAVDAADEPDVLQRRTTVRRDQPRRVCGHP